MSSVIRLLWQPIFGVWFAGVPGVDAHVPKLSFSAALSVPMEHSGTIVFDKILVNDGSFYDPATGNVPAEFGFKDPL